MEKEQTLYYDGSKWTTTTILQNVSATAVQASSLYDMTTPKGMCENCKEHSATETWIGEEGTLAYTHGRFRFWCKCCVINEQLKYAKKLSERIPDLEEELRNLQCNQKETKTNE